MSKRRPRYTVRERLHGSGDPSWGDQIAQSRAYVAGRTPAQRLRAVRNLIVNQTRPLGGERREQTEAYLESDTLSRGYSKADYEEAVGQLLDEGVIASTIIDGKEHGFVPALYGVSGIGGKRRS